jgi:hypothetical protein
MVGLVFGLIDTVVIRMGSALFEWIERADLGTPDRARFGAAASQPIGGTLKIAIGLASPRSVVTAHELVVQMLWQCRRRKTMRISITACATAYRSWRLGCVSNLNGNAGLHID